MAKQPRKPLRQLDVFNSCPSPLAQPRVLNAFKQEKLSNSTTENVATSVYSPLSGCAESALNIKSSEITTSYKENHPNYVGDIFGTHKSLGITPETPEGGQPSPSIPNPSILSDNLVPDLDFGQRCEDETSSSLQYKKTTTTRSHSPSIPSSTHRISIHDRKRLNRTNGSEAHLTELHLEIANLRNRITELTSELEATLQNAVSEKKVLCLQIEHSRSLEHSLSDQVDKLEYELGIRNMLYRCALTTIDDLEGELRHHRDALHKRDMGGRIDYFLQSRPNMGDSDVELELDG